MHHWWFIISGQGKIYISIYIYTSYTYKHIFGHCKNICLYVVTWKFTSIADKQPFAKDVRKAIPQIIWTGK